MVWEKGKELNNGKFIVVGEKPLGSGGFGITYKVARTRDRKLFVIKTLNAIAQNRSNFRQLKDDFFNEATTLAGFKHPNIVKIYPKGFTEEVDELWCMVMEFIEGQNLAEYLEENKEISEIDAIALITKVGEALTYIHQSNYVHRDIKPSNIMLRNCDLLSPVLIDFGLAREFDPNQSLTMDNRLTEHFAPLEQYNLDSYTKYINLDRNQYKVGTWTDVYALAATLYNLLTNHLPMPAPMRSLSPQDFKSPKQLNPKISDRTNTAILKGMSLNPQDRPQTVSEWLELLVEDLQVSETEDSQSSQKGIGTLTIPIIIFICSIIINFVLLKEYIWYLIILILLVLLGITRLRFVYLYLKSNNKEKQKKSRYFINSCAHAYEGVNWVLGISSVIFAIVMGLYDFFNDVNNLNFSGLGWQDLLGYIFVAFISIFLLYFYFAIFWMIGNFLKLPITWFLIALPNSIIRKYDIRNSDFVSIKTSKEYVIPYDTEDNNNELYVDYNWDWEELLMSTEWSFLLSGSITKVISPRLINGQAVLQKSTYKTNQVSLVDNTDVSNTDVKLVKSMASPVKYIVDKIDPTISKIEQNVIELQKAKDLALSSNLYAGQVEIYSKSIAQKEKLIRDARKIKQEYLQLIREILISQELDMKTIPNLAKWQNNLNLRYEAIEKKSLLAEN
ncbi:MAG: protein kinase [Cyanobacteria bacterium P01_A01_bin.83]